MLTDAARSTMLGLVQGACHVVTPNRYSVSGSRRGIAYYDTSRDEPITEVTEFAGAVAARIGNSNGISSPAPRERPPRAAPAGAPQRQA